MKERPILFSAPMVRALLAGTKTQTRRLVKPMHVPMVGRPPAIGAPWYAEPGDRLWVKETWRVVSAAEGDIGYRATESYQRFLSEGGRAWWKQWEAKSWGKSGATWCPSIYMPRWASRITLEVTSVRVERLHDLTEEDAWAEGVERVEGGFRNYVPERFACRTALRADESFFTLWESINGAESLASNPWVWVVSFKQIEVSGG